MKFYTHQLTDLPATAQAILNYLGNRRKIALYGQMGTGKTTLVRTFCELLGVVDTPSSPTYALIHQYKTTQQTLVYHLDLYRINDLSTDFYAEIETCLFDDNFCFIEWPEVLGNYLPDHFVRLYASTLEDDTRVWELNF